MKADSRQVERFLSTTDIQFIIPIYQRNYDWDTTQCKQLLKDICRAGSDEQINEHFIGSIVYIQDDIYTSAEIKEFVVIDGQQRLTTLTLIYLALYNKVQHAKNTELANKINKRYLINEFAEDASKLKLKATANNNKILQNLLKGKIETREFSNIINNYDYIFQFIKNEKNEIIVKGLSKLICVEIILDRGKDNPQRIFESLNSTGLALSQGDLIRNYILMGLAPKQQEELYINFWERIESKAKSETNNQSKVSDFIRDYLTLKNSKIPNQNAVYDEFKITYPSHFTFENLEKELGKIASLAEYYHKLINPQHEIDTEIRLHLKYINQLDVTVAYPFLMQVYDDYANHKIDKTIFIQVLELVQSFVWRRFIVSLPTNALNKIFMNLYTKVEPKNYLYSIQHYLCSLTGTQRFPRNEETTDILQFKDVYSIKKKNTMYLLSRIENFNNNEPVSIEDNTDITIEHIFPQNPSDEWQQELDDQEYTDIKDNYLHTISNLTLSGNNGKLGNKSFQEKRDLKNHGYTDSRLWLNKYLAGQNNWNITAIKARFAKIADRFLQIWQYPPIEITKIIKTEEVNIFDADDPTGKELDYAIFKGEKIVVNNMAEFYVEVIKRLFTLEPKILFSPALKVLKLTENSYINTLRAPKNISSMYCFETHSSSIGKFNNIKKALELYELENELFIKYKS